MLDDKPAFDVGLSLASPLAAEAMGGTGIAFIMADNQHHFFRPGSTITTLMELGAGSAVPVTRVARNA